MQTALTFSSNPLLPSLPDAQRPRDKSANHNLSTHPLRGGDQLHVKQALLGFPRGMVLPICGYRTLRDPDGTVYGVTAYVLPLADTPHAVAFTERDYKRFPSATQSERWFGTPPVCLVEIDLTDHEDDLRLERGPEVVAEQLNEYASRRAWIEEAAPLRRAA